MKAVTNRRWLVLAPILFVRFALAQEVAGPDPQQKQDHATQLTNCRAGIIDPEARPEDRRRWIETLLAFETSDAKDLVVQLLTGNDQPVAKQALCDVIAERARRAPDRVDPLYLDPLMELLGASSDTLRASAARALAAYPGPELPTRLGALAARDDVAMVKRLAAIDALAPRVDQRNVVQELMNLLDAGVPEIPERVTQALEPASREPIGGDSSKWKAWWARKSKLSSEKWLADRLEMYRERYSDRSGELEAFRNTSLQREGALSGRLAELQRELFHGLSEGSREAKLVEWLGDPLPEVRRGALLIIRARIADEGQKPAGGTLKALLRLIEDESPAMRTEVLLIVQNLNEPEVINAVLARLDREQDPAVRHAIFKTIGKLDRPEAVPALIAEIASPTSSQDCVREAAVALGRVASKATDPALTAEAVSALKRRYQQTAGQVPALRAALLSAMGGIAPKEFVAEFLEEIESSDPAILRPAIFGLMSAGDKSKLPRLRTLTADADPQVRKAAVEAVARLGGEDADVESVLTRLNPAIESNELVRDAAWQAFSEISRDKPPSVQIQLARRLRETPDLELRYLLLLTANRSTAKVPAEDSEPILDRLGILLTEQGKFAEAVAPLRSLFESRADRGASDTFDAGMRWLNAALQSHEQNDVAEIVTRVAGTANGDDDIAKIVRSVDGFFTDIDQINDQGARILLANLRTVRGDILGESWTTLLDEVATRLNPDHQDTTTAPSGS